jgi:di- and tripeptidase
MIMSARSLLVRRNFTRQSRRNGQLTPDHVNGSGQKTPSLMARWRFPSLTIHKIVTSGSSHGSVIPHKARAVISMRIVPDQCLNQIVSLFKKTIETKFAEFQSDNDLTVSAEHQADWWLGDPENRGFKALEKAVREEWGIEPLYIREVVT